MDIIKQCTISELNINISKCCISGIIIGKSNVKRFNTNSSDNVRGVLSFTVRDSARHFVNCVVWGTESFCESYNVMFKIGDGIKIVSPKIDKNKLNEYSPLTSSGFQLTINEGLNKILLNTDNELNGFQELLNAPIKPTTSVLKLIDISSISAQTKGEFVDLLVVVRRIYPVKKINSKYTGTTTYCRNIIVMDQSYASLCFTIWNNAIIERSNNWLEMMTVLQLIDVRAVYSTYQKTITIGTTGRTLIVENPKSKESKYLASYALSQPTFDNHIASDDQYVDLSLITTIMSTKQIHDRSVSTASLDSNNKFTAVTYAVLTEFDLDGYQNIIIRKCNRCNKIMKLSGESCENEDCLLLHYENYQNEPKYVDIFDISVGLSDHTGSLNKCHLNGATAERILKCSLAEFRKMSDTKKGLMKWKWLLNRCKVHLEINKKSGYKNPISVNILNMVLVGDAEVADKIKVY